MRQDGGHRSTGRWINAGASAADMMQHGLSVGHSPERPVPLSRRWVCRGLLTLAALGPAASAPAKAPRRIVTLDYGLAETMLVLGMVPLGLPDTPGWAQWVVEPPLPDSVQNLGSDLELNLELLASLKPDLILTTPYLDALAPALESIAPCERLAIYEEGGDDPLPRAEAVTRRVAALLGVPERAESYLTSAQAQFEADRARLAALAQASLILVNVIDARHVRVYGAKSLWQDVLDRLGRSNGWPGPTTYWGFATIGVEELSAAPGNAVLVAFDPVPPDAQATLARSPLWRSLPFVQAGRTVRLAPALVFGAVPSARRFSRLLAAGLADMKVPG